MTSDVYIFPFLFFVSMLYKQTEKKTVDDEAEEERVVGFFFKQAHVWFLFSRIVE